MATTQYKIAPKPVLVAVQVVKFVLTMALVGGVWIGLSIIPQALAMALGL